MSRTSAVSPLVALVFALPLARPASAQTIGTFRWQLQPFCNAITVTVVQQGANYQLDGYDDQCGAPQRAPLVGLGTANPDGSIGFGFQIVTVPGGAIIGVDARISPATIGGTWRDSSGNSGTFAFNGSAGGHPRPPASASTIPSTISLLNTGGLVAGGITGSSPIPTSGAGTRMMWHPGKAAFRAGEVTTGVPTAWDEANVGLDSAAFGRDTVAGGWASLAVGNGTTAGGPFSVATGDSTVATGSASVAYGVGSTASGTGALAGGSGTRAQANYAVAFGQQSTADGNSSLALGYNTQALGHQSIAGGQNAIARGAGSAAFNNAQTTVAATASFAWGDYSTSTPIVADIAGQFKVRATGGVRFVTNAADTAGVVLFGGNSAWSSISDRNMKRDIRELDGEDVLARLARMPVSEWGYKAQDASIRHMGPMAQDFHAAFGLGEDPLRISTIDADGVALAAARALEARTRATNERLLRELDALRDRLAALEAALSARPR
jgi:hypothetical protein